MMYDPKEYKLAAANEEIEFLRAENEALRARVGDNDNLCEAIADMLMTMGGTGEVADRLVLEKDGLALGGRIRASVIGAIKSAMEDQPND